MRGWLHLKGTLMFILGKNYQLCTRRLVIVASGAVKHEDLVEQVKKLFTKLSSDPTTTSELVAKGPAIFSGFFVLKSFDFLFLLFFLFFVLNGGVVRERGG
ncbi:unnamed protein product [Camellia sinensis]